MLLNKTSLALANLAEKEESRYTLNGIAVEKECTVVTNGHYLVTVDHVSDRKDSDFPATPGLETKAIAANETVLIARETAIAASKALPKKTTIPVLRLAALGTDKTLYVNQLDSVQTFKSSLEGKFPNWRMVMPTGKPEAEIVLSAAYLELLAKFMREHGDERAPSVRITVYGVDRPVRFDAKSRDGQLITAVLMPMRGGAADYAQRPDQIAAESKAKAKAAKQAEPVPAEQPQAEPVAA